MGHVPKPELELRLIPDAASLIEDASSRLARLAADGTIKVDETDVRDCHEVDNRPFQELKW